MSDIVQIGFDYSVLDEDTRIFVKVKAESIQARLKRTAEDIIAIGHDLKAVQEKLSKYHGGTFGAWLMDQFEMSHQTAYNFMRVAEKFGDRERFKTVLNLSPKILYALASAPDEIVEKVQSGEIKATKEQSLLEEINQAKREVKEREEQLKAKQGELDLFQENKRLQDEKLSRLEEDLRLLDEEKNKIEQSKVQILKEDLPETTAKVLAMEKQLKDLEAQKQKLKSEKEQKIQRVKELTDEVKKYAEVDKQAKRNEQIRTKWRQACDAYHQGVNQGSARMVTPIDAQQAFESDDWARLAEVEATLKQSLATLVHLRESVTNQFVESSVEPAMYYVET